PQTRLDNARFFDGDLAQVPPHCITQGLGTIMEARHVVLFASGEGKAEAAWNLVEGPVSAMWPATILQHHPHATVLPDERAASKRENRDSWRETYGTMREWQGISTRLARAGGGWHDAAMGCGVPRGCARGPRGPGDGWAHGPRGPLWARFG